MKGDHHKPGNNHHKPFDLVSLSIETMQGTITNLRLAAAPPDHLVMVPRNTCSFYEFHRAEEIMALGYKLAGEAIPA
jgi:NTE family protein